MPKPLTIATLPSSVRQDLDQKLRSGGYGDALGLSAWLGGLGHPVGKSSVHRYAVRLRHMDAAAGNGMASILAVSKPAKGVRTADRGPLIVHQLQRLHRLQSALLNELATLPNYSKSVTHS